MLKKILLSSVIALGIAPANAAVVSATGSGIIGGSAAGLDLSTNADQSARAKAYDEGQSVLIDENQVYADYVVGENLSVGDSDVGVMSTAGGIAVAAGSYDSHLIKWDPVGGAGFTEASFTFSGDIVAIILSNEGSSKLLNLSDAIFGTAASYTKDHGRRVEDNEGFTLTASNVLTFTDWFTGGKWTDQARVLTVPAAVVPVPASLPLLLTAFGGVALMRRKRKTT